MSQQKNSSRTTPTQWAPLPAAMTGTRSPAVATSSQPTDDAGVVRLGGQAPMFAAEAVADDGRVRLGGQAPMFLPEIIADAGLVRLGGQSPTF